MTVAGERSATVAVALRVGPTYPSSCRCLYTLAMVRVGIGVTVLPCLAVNARTQDIEFIAVSDPLARWNQCCGRPFNRVIATVAAPIKQK
jgi:hypothetical protein